VQVSSRVLSRSAALTIFVALLGLPIYFGLLPLLQSYSELSEDLTQKRAILARFETELAGREGLEQELGAVVERHQADRIYLQGASEAAAAAALQERLGTLAEANRAELRSVQALPAVEADGLRRLTLRVVLSATTSELLHVLYALETEKPYIFIENIELKIYSASKTEADDHLLVRFDLLGFLNPLQIGEAT
jgi:general secretion pathway protein M